MLEKKNHKEIVYYISSNYLEIKTQELLLKCAKKLLTEEKVVYY